MMNPLLVGSSDPLPLPGVSGGAPGGFATRALGAAAFAQAGAVRVGGSMPPRL